MEATSVTWANNLGQASCYLTRPQLPVTPGAAPDVSGRFYCTRSKYGFQAFLGSSGMMGVTTLCRVEDCDEPHPKRPRLLGSGCDYTSTATVDVASSSFTALHSYLPWSFPAHQAAAGCGPHMPAGGAEVCRTPFDIAFSGNARDSAQHQPPHRDGLLLAHRNVQSSPHNLTCSWFAFGLTGCEAERVTQHLSTANGVAPVCCSQRPCQSLPAEHAIIIQQQAQQQQRVLLQQQQLWQHRQLHQQQRQEMFSHPCQAAALDSSTSHHMAPAAAPSCSHITHPWLCSATRQPYADAPAPGPATGAACGPVRPQLTVCPQALGPRPVWAAGACQQAPPAPPAPVLAVCPDPSCYPYRQSCRQQPQPQLLPVHRPSKPRAPPQPQSSLAIDLPTFAPATPPLDTDAPREHILLLCRALCMSESTTARLALHIWNRIQGMVRLLVSVRQPTGAAGAQSSSYSHQSRTFAAAAASSLERVYCVAALWLAAKLEERRREVPAAATLAVAARTSPGVLVGAELCVLRWCEWAPYAGFVPDESHLLFDL